MADLDQLNASEEGKKVGITIPPIYFELQKDFNHPVIGYLSLSEAKVYEMYVYSQGNYNRFIELLGFRGKSRQSATTSFRNITETLHKVERQETKYDIHYLLRFLKSEKPLDTLKARVLSQTNLKSAEIYIPQILYCFKYNVYGIKAISNIIGKYTSSFTFQNWYYNIYQSLRDEISKDYSEF